jgi:hypothetical protein
LQFFANIVRRHLPKRRTIMPKCVALSAFFSAAILLGLSGRLTLVRAAESGTGQVPDKPAAPAEKPVGAGADPFAAPAGTAAPAAVGADAGPFNAADGSGVPAKPASMKITVGKASGRKAAAELAALEETIEKALAKPVTLDVVETPLDKVVEQLSRELGVNVLLDRKALDDVGIDPATTVSCKVTNLPLRFALDELLRAFGTAKGGGIQQEDPNQNATARRHNPAAASKLGWTVRNGVLLVTSEGEVESMLTTRVYDVSSLVVGPPDYPASRSSDLGDVDPLFGPLSERNEPYGVMWASGPPKGWNGMGMGGMMNVKGQSESPPILQQRAAAGMGGGQGNCGQQVPRGYRSPLDFDSVVDSITSTIDPTQWDDVGGACSIAPFPSQLLLVVSATMPVQEKVARYLDTLRHHVDTRPQIRIEAHWLWLTEPELASLLAGKDQASPLAGDVVDEAAWKKLRQQKRDDADDASGDFVEMGAFEAILKGQNGQLISGVSGRQTRVMVTLIPVVGDPPQLPGGGYHSSVGYQPVCRTIQEGGALEVRP